MLCRFPSSSNAVDFLHFYTPSENAKKEKLYDISSLYKRARSEVNMSINVLLDMTPCNLKVIITFLDNVLLPSSG